MKSPRLRIPLLAVMLLLSVSAVLAANTFDGEKKDEKPKVIYEPEAEVKFAEFLTKMKEAKRIFWISGMKSEVALIAKTTGLEEAGAKTLEAAAPGIVDLCIPTWADKVDALYRQNNYQNLPDLLDWFDRLIAMAAIYARQVTVNNYSTPLGHEEWAQAVERVLTPNQHVEWIKVRTARLDKVKNDVAEFLKPLVHQRREEQKTELLDRIANLKFLVSFSKESEEKLVVLAEAIAGEAAEAVRQKSEKFLLALDADQRRECFKNRNFYFGDDEQSPANWGNVWRERAIQVVSKEEQTCWNAVQQERHARRTRLLSRTTLTLLDDRVAFSTRQRQQLEPVLERVLPAQRWLFPEDSSQDVFGASPQIFFEAAARAPEAEIKSIVDEVQWKRWQELCLSSRNRQAGRFKPSQKPPPSQLANDQELVENAISNFFHERTAFVRKELFASISLRAEDIVRVTEAGPSVVGRLRSAAQGAVEEVLHQWRTSMDRAVHAELQEVPAADISKRLLRWSSSYFSDRDIDKNAVWLKTVETELNEAQRALWQNQLNERDSYRQKAICSMILAEFDRETAVSSQQLEKLEPLVATALNEYSRDISETYSSDRNWYLEGYVIFIPAALVPETDLKAILEKAQWEHWTRSEAFSFASQNIQNLKVNHQQRIKAEKP